MDEVFRALADGSRRELLDRLRAENGQTLGDLCDRLNMTRQAVSKHLGILEEANLIATVKRGREKLHYLNAVPIHEIGERWIGKFERSRLRALRRRDKFCCLCSATETSGASRVPRGAPLKLSGGGGSIERGEVIGG